MSISITSQPATNSINAAYRPIMLSVSIVPAGPVMYCDVYFNLIFYKTISKTQGFDFDIQDAAKEYLKKYLPPSGGSAMYTASTIYTSCFVKIRSSAYDAKGYLVPDAPVPVQGTGGTAPASGGGVQSHTFYIVNSALQHEDNQDLASHLSAYKTGTWATGTFPLSHRLDGYKINKKASDFFPIVSNTAPSCLTVHYKLKSASGFLTATDCGGVVNPPPPPPPTCVPVTISGTPSLPDGQVGVAYSYTINLAGTAPFNLTNLVKPSWMNITVNGSQITLTGTPITEGSAITVSFSINNDCGTAPASGSIDIAPAEVVNGPHFGDTVFNGGDTLNTSETATLVGVPNSTMTVTLTEYTNSNGGQLLVNGAQAFQGNTWDVVLDANGNGSLNVAIHGTSNTQTVIRGVFTITAISAGGTVGTPDTYQISKIF